MLTGKRHPLHGAGRGGCQDSAEHAVMPPIRAEHQGRAGEENPIKEFNGFSWLKNVVFKLTLDSISFDSVKKKKKNTFNSFPFINTHQAQIIKYYFPESEKSSLKEKQL